MSQRTIYAVHVKTNKNIGDDASTPLHYFPGLTEGFKKKTVVIGTPTESVRIPDASRVILGGGGLLASKKPWDAMILDLLDRDCQVVAWGLGLNRSRSAAANAPGRIPAFTARFDMFGLRDWLPDVRWVPCASAMSDAMLTPSPISRRIGFYLHLDRVELLPDALKPLVTQDNMVTNMGSLADLPRALEFLSGCEVVVSNSYHGAYWAMLLKRRAIIFDRFSEKFELFRWKPTKLEDHASLDEAIDAAVVHEQALDEARAANIAFYDDYVSRYGA